MRCRWVRPRCRSRACAVSAAPPCRRSCQSWWLARCSVRRCCESPASSRADPSPLAAPVRRRSSSPNTRSARHRCGRSMDCRRAGSRPAPSRRRRSDPIPACAAAGADLVASLDEAPSAVHRDHSGCGRSRAPDTHVRRSRADGSGCSRHRPSIRRCPRHHTQLRAAEGAEVPGTVDHVARQRCDFLLHRGEGPGPGRVGPLVDLGLPLERSTVRLRRCRLLRSHERTDAGGGHGERHRKRKRCADGRLVVMIDSSTCDQVL